MLPQNKQAAEKIISIIIALPVIKEDIIAIVEEAFKIKETLENQV